MKIVFINSYRNGSTGNIAKHCAELAQKNGDETRLYVSTESKGSEALDGCRYWGWNFERLVHYYLAVLTGYNGCFSIISTIIMIGRLKKYQPDILHFHNLHNCYINLPLLFSYIKKNSIPVIWTLHDCWAFTGQCPYYTLVGCHKWETGCYECPQHRNYPKSIPDRTKTIYRLKKKWFTGIKDLNIVTPSRWLAGEISRSFLAGYPTTVIYNGIDLSIFKPTESDFRSQHKLESKYIILGVAFGWDQRKGLDVFQTLAKKLPAHYQIVLVGTDDTVETGILPEIICIKRTRNKKELAQIYSAADVFVNPTREDNFPTVNIESLACGTPVITFNTGGSPEAIDETCGSVINNDEEAIFKEIVRISEERPYTKEACLHRAQMYDMKERFRDYIHLYHKFAD